MIGYKTNLTRFPVLGVSEYQRPRVGDPVNLYIELVDVLKAVNKTHDQTGLHYIVKAVDHVAMTIELDHVEVPPVYSQVKPLLHGEVRNEWGITTHHREVPKSYTRAFFSADWSEDPALHNLEGYYTGATHAGGWYMPGFPLPVAQKVVHAMGGTFNNLAQTFMLPDERTPITKEVIRADGQDVEVWFVNTDGALCWNLER